MPDTGEPSTDPASQKPTPPRRVGRFRDTFLYSAPVIVSTIVPVLTIPIVTRILTPAEFGLWGLSTAFGLFVTGLANLGLPIGYDRNFYEADTPEKQAALLYSVVGFVSVLILIGGVLTFLFNDQLSRWILQTRGHGSLLVISYTAAGLSSIKVYFLTYFRNHGQAKNYVRYNIDETILAAVASVGLLAVFNLGVEGYASGYLVATGSVTVVLFFGFLRRLRPSFDGGVLAETLKFSLPLAPRILLGGLGSQFDKYLLGLLGSPTAVGVYTLGQRVGQLGGNYMAALQNVYLPQVYRHMFTGPAEGRAISAYLLPFFYFSIAISLVTALFAEEAISLLAPGAYRQAATVAILFALYIGSTFFGRLPQLQFGKRTGVIGFISILSFVLTVLMVIYGARVGGAVGAAAGVVASSVIVACATLALGQRVYRIDYKWQEYGGMLLFLAGSAALVELLRWMGWPYLIRIAVKLMLLAAFFGVGVRWKIFSRERIASLSSWLGPKRVRQP